MSEFDVLRSGALRRVAEGLDLPESMVDDLARMPRADSRVGEAHPWAAGAGSAPRAAVRPVTASGFVVDSQAHRRRRIALRRNLYRCNSAAMLMASLMAGAFAVDRPVAGVAASALAFMLLKCAAEARAEL